MPYQPVRPAQSRFETVRGLRLHCSVWGDESLVDAATPPLVLTHGWMDVGASFQFVVDALAAIEGPRRWVIAPDWRGFGLSSASGADSYWFPDYLGDLDALLSRLAPAAPVDLLGHSMGGNIVMSYAGVRPQRVRRLVNLEGFGLPATEPAQAPARLAQWLDELARPERLRPYADLAAVSARLVANNPRLGAERAEWLAAHWARPGEGGSWELLADPAHKRVNPVLYRVDEVLETWKRITAPLMWMEGEHTEAERWWGHRYSREAFHRRLDAVTSPVTRHHVAGSGHMLHHDRPDAVSTALVGFLA